MDSVGFNIRKIREKRGFSQDYVAQELNISQASYARLENENTKITVDRLYKIAEILEVDISDFFNGSKLKINTQNNYEGSYGNGYIQNLYVDNKEIVKKLIESYETIVKEKDEQIKLLKEKLL